MRRDWWGRKRNDGGCCNKNKTVRQTPLERLKIPLRAVATNVQTVRRPSLQRGIPEGQAGRAAPSPGSSSRSGCGKGRDNA